MQPTGYGFDNRCMLDALAQLGDMARARSWSSRPTRDDAELQRLHALGVRGVRFMMIPGAGGVLPWDALEPIAARASRRSAGTSTCSSTAANCRSTARASIALPCKLVIDHTGKFLEPVPPEHAAFETLLSRAGAAGPLGQAVGAVRNVEVRPARTTTTSPHWPRALLAAHPDRCLWASNWPHPNRNPAPSDAAMLALLDDWTGNAALCERVLVHNPAAFYGY